QSKSSLPYHLLFLSFTLQNYKEIRKPLLHDLRIVLPFLPKKAITLLLVLKIFVPRDAQMEVARLSRYIFSPYFRQTLMIFINGLLGTGKVFPNHRVD
ncbi:MAG: hypothetical protein AUK63_2377, partial [bacterium P3]